MDTQTAVITHVDRFGRRVILTERNETLILYPELDAHLDHGQTGDTIRIGRAAGKRRATDWRVLA